MKQSIILFLLLASLEQVQSQNKSSKFLTLAVTTSQTAMPFGKFSKLFTSDLHPGVETGIGFNWSAKKRHDWFQEIKAGYFYHRFVQHGFPVYTNLGYRYKFSSKVSGEALLGGGYMHSVPATAKLRLDEEGEYKNDKGAGRMQAMVNFGIRFSYSIQQSHPQPMKLFLQYQQQLQMPFVKSYVPLLPYNIFMIGISRSLRSNN